ncbi:MAG: thiamine pyrophosphate-dependent enzyme [Planctomycetaceae bacterium]
MKPGGRIVIHVNFVSAEVDPVYFPQVEVIGDIANSIWRIGKELPNDCERDDAIFDKVQAALKEHISRDASDDRFPIWPQRLVADVRKVIQHQGIIALDNGIYKIWFARNYPAYSPNTILLDNALASMGAGLPSAMMAAMLYPDRRVMAICGDGGFMMNSAEMETAVRLKLNLVILLLRDDALGMIKWKQQHMGFKEYGLDFGNPDFVKYADVYGASGHRIESSEEFMTTVNAAFDAGGVHLIDVPVDYSENERILFDEIKEMSRAI